MSTFNVELKKVVDDSYEIETGYHLEENLINDLKNGLVGKTNKFVVITDSIVKELYADSIYNMLLDAGYKADILVFPEGEKSKTRQTFEKNDLFFYTKVSSAGVKYEFVDYSIEEVDGKKILNIYVESSYEHAMNHLGAYYFLVRVDEGLSEGVDDIDVIEKE